MGWSRLGLSDPGVGDGHANDGQPLSEGGERKLFTESAQNASSLAGEGGDRTGQFRRYRQIQPHPLYSFQALRGFPSIQRISRRPVVLSEFRRLAIPYRVRFPSQGRVHLMIPAPGRRCMPACIGPASST